MARIGLLTGGGDCPGLNAVIRAVVRKGTNVHGHEFFGFTYGWAGVLSGEGIELNAETTRGILHRGGTILGTSRTNPLADSAFQQQLFAILQTRATAGIKERTFNGTFPQSIIYVEEISASQVGLSGLLVSDERDPAVSRIVTAREGRLLTDEAQRRVTLRFIDGSVSELIRKSRE